MDIIAIGVHKIQKKSLVFQATIEPQIVRKTSRRQVEFSASVNPHLPPPSVFGSFLAFVR
jgi:hypothetical protein